MHDGDGVISAHPVPTPASSSLSTTIQVANFKQILLEASLQSHVCCSIQALNFPSGLDDQSGPSVLSSLKDTWVCRGPGLALEIHITFHDDLLLSLRENAFLDQLAIRLQAAEVNWL